MPQNQIDLRTAMEIISHEAVVRQAYKDSVGKWTWSAGLTSATGHIVERYIDNPQPMSKCLAIFIWALEKYAGQVREAFPGIDLTQEQFAAALSFHWNTGAIKRASWVKRFRAGDVAGARKAFMDWRKPPEIVPRRQKERDLFFDGKWSSDGTVTEYTRLTSRHTPVWSSAKRVNIEADLIKALGAPSPAPESNQTPPRGVPRGPLAILAGGLIALAAAAYAFLKSLGVTLP